MNKKILLLVTLALAAVAWPAVGDQPPVAGGDSFYVAGGERTSGTPLTGNPLFESLAALEAAADPGQAAANAGPGDTAPAFAQPPGDTAPIAEQSAERSFGDTAPAAATPEFGVSGKANSPREASEVRQPGEPQRLGPAAAAPAAVGLFGLGKGGPGAGTGPAMPNLMTAGDMIGFSRDVGEGVQAITIINASRRWMAVYHLDNEGRIRLMSSRPLDADFTIQFNATSPLPEEIRRLQGK